MSTNTLTHHILHEELAQEAEALGLRHNHKTTLYSSTQYATRYYHCTTIEERNVTKMVWLHHEYTTTAHKLYIPGIKYTFDSYDSGVRNDIAIPIHVCLRRTEVFIPRGNNIQKLKTNDFPLPNSGCYGDGAKLLYPDHSLAEILNDFWEHPFNKDVSPWGSGLWNHIATNHPVETCDIRTVFEYWESLTPAEVIKLLSDTDNVVQGQK